MSSLGLDSYWASVEARREKERIDRYERETGEVYIDPDGYDRYGVYWGDVTQEGEEDD